MNSSSITSRSSLVSFVSTTLLSPFKWRTFALFFVMANVLTGCALFPSVPEPEVEAALAYKIVWPIQQERLKNVKKFTIKGKIGYIDPEQRQSLTYVYKRNGSSMELELFATFGKSVLRMVDNPKYAAVYIDGKRHSSSSATLVLERYTGFNIPIEPLADWVKGLPTNADTTEFYNTGSVKSLQMVFNRKNWKLDYESYSKFANTSRPNLYLPDHFTLTQDDTSVKVSISQWIF